MLSGASSQWKNARSGKVFDTLVNGDYANPVMVLDEIDKAGGDSQYDPLGNPAMPNRLPVQRSA